MPNIVIVGGGVSGLMTAKKLVGKKHNVTIISSTPFFEWPIAGSYSLTHPDELKKAVSGDGHHIKGVKHVVGIAVGIDDCKITLNDHSVIEYDCLVLAVGLNIPCFLPKMGQSWSQREAEVAQIGSAIRKASTVLIGGGGTVAVEFAGDVREVNKQAQVVMVTRGDKPLRYLDGKYSSKLQNLLQKYNVEVITNDAVSEDGPVLEMKTFKLRSGKELRADLYIPAFQHGINGGFTGLADDTGAIKVNDFLQAEGNHKVFAVGCSNKEFSAIPKVDGQSKTVAQNVLLLLEGKPLKKHVDGMAQLTHPMSQKFGHKTYAWLEPAMLPGPGSACAKNCGFPCFPCFCCWPLALCGCTPCHPMACGVCCADPEGAGTMAAMRSLLHGTGMTGIKGLGSAPEMQVMK